MRLLAPFALLVGLSAIHLPAQSAPDTNSQDSDKVVISGNVPDEAARAAIVSRLRDVYGNGRIVEQLEVGGVVPPPNWTTHIAKAIGPSLKNVRRGELQVRGKQVTLKGEVANEALRQQIASEIATALNPTYTIDNALIVKPRAQDILDDTLADRTIEFLSGSAELSTTGISVLDEMAAAIANLDNPEMQVVGHTDGSGDRMSNIALSLQRANTVRDYLAGKGIDAQRISALGRRAGQAAGLQRNRRRPGAQSTYRISHSEITRHGGPRTVRLNMPFTPQSLSSPRASFIACRFSL